MRARWDVSPRGMSLAAAVLFNLAACAPDTPPLPGLSASVPASEFRCPAPGPHTAPGQDGRATVSRGADPADPLVCLGTGPSGAPFRRVANLIAAPPGQERAVRDGLAALFPTAVGKEAQYSYFQGYSNDLTNTGHFREHWRTLGGQTLDVGGAPVQTVVFQRDVNELQRYGTVAKRWLLWFAPERGTWVRGQTLF